MTRILAVSSQVACGHVGLSAIVPAVQALGHDIIALPTIIISNHPGHPHVAGSRIEPKTVDAMVDALEANGWLKNVDRVLTGYLPTEGHVASARRMIDLAKLSSPSATIMCDPVIGDEVEGIYIDIHAADAIREQLLPVADILLPNAFELGWLANRQITTEDDAVIAARSLRPSQVLATSIPTSDPSSLANLLITQHSIERYQSRKQKHIPKGTGDFLSGVFVADPDLARTIARVNALVEASIGNDHLAISASLDTWRNAQPAAVENP